MRITIKEVVKIIGRDTSAVYRYMARKPALLPQPCHHPKRPAISFWDREEVNSFMPDVLEYQKSTKRSKSEEPEKAKSLPRKRPPETPAQQAARLSFDLCVN